MDDEVLRAWAEGDRDEVEAFHAWARGHPAEMAEVQRYLFDSDPEFREWVTSTTVLQVKTTWRLFQEWKRRQGSGA